MNDGDKTEKTQEELKAAISEKKDVWMAKPNGTVGLLERSEVYEVRKVKDCLVNMLAYASDLDQGLVYKGVSGFGVAILPERIETPNLRKKPNIATGSGY